jgi:hypothetical protein
MADNAYEWLGAEHQEYTARKAAWEREERRLAGQDAVLDELTLFDYEETKAGEHYKGRQAEATYLPLPMLHASLVTGHLRRHAPTPGKGLDFGALGEVRSRDKITEPTLAELLWYNVDGIGNDGSSWEAWWDDLDVRAQGTGHRWVMIEHPDTTPITLADQQKGARPYAVEYSPLEVPNWYFNAGQLQFAVIRVFVTPPRVEAGQFIIQKAEEMGYYLLVRAGYEGLGEDFVQGGWWLFDRDKKPLPGRDGRWVSTKGEIPLFVHFGRKARGTKNNPRMSASDTMELGQLAVEMMNTHSARKFDFWDACSSKTYIVGATPEIMKVATDSYKKSQLVAIPANIEESTGAVRMPSVYDGSAGAVSADVADKLEVAQWARARRLSMEKVSTPGESGTSKDAGFAEASAPDLVRRAMLREQSENTFLFFASLRFGKSPNCSSLWQKDFELTSLMDEIDEMFNTLKMAGTTSATLAVELVMTAIKERGVISDPAKLKVIEAELTAEFTKAEAQRNLDKQFLSSFTKGGDKAPPTGDKKEQPPADDKEQKPPVPAAA